MSTKSQLMKHLKPYITEIVIVFIKSINQRNSNLLITVVQIESMFFKLLLMYCFDFYYL